MSNQLEEVTLKGKKAVIRVEVGNSIGGMASHRHINTSAYGTLQEVSPY
jgi:hypothetical protein